MIITHNISAINTMNKLNGTNKSLNKTTERLSSGYRINRAADDAAGLAISEEKRAQIRGLMRSARNSEEGISFVQTGDGAMSEMTGLLQRMRELTVQSLNDAVLTPADRACLQMEFEALQREVDRLNDQTEYNTQPIFEHYQDEYAVFEGNRVWPQNQTHIIDSSNSSLTVKYIMTDEKGAEVEKERTLTIPNGTYTTQELIDEMDDVITAFRDSMDGIALEYTKGHTCNMVVQNENIKEIVDVSGGLSYLFFGTFGGNNTGSLIGTTQIAANYPLDIVTGKNDELHFKIEYFDGTEKTVDIKVPQDSYTRKDMIDYLNGELSGTGMKADFYGDSYIQIGGTTGIITGLKGNMFEIDDKTGQSYDSVFYDNTKYGSATEVSAVFSGGYIIPTTDMDYSKTVFDIDNTNNTLSVSVDGSGYKTITLDTKDNYSMSEMVNHLQQKFDAAFGAGAVKVTSQTTSQPFKTPNGQLINFQNIVITSSSKGDTSDISFEKNVANSAYETLFTERNYTDIGKSTSAVDGTYSSSGTYPSITSEKSFNAGGFPIKFTDTNNTFKLFVTEHGMPQKECTITLTAGKPYNSLNDIINELNKCIADQTNYGGKIMAVSYGANRIQIRSTTSNNTVTAINASGAVNSAYDILFAGKATEYPNSKNVTLNEITNKPPLNDDGTITFSKGDNKLTVTIGGEVRNIEVDPGKYTVKELEEELNKKLKGEEKITDDYYNDQTYNRTSGQTVSTSNSPYKETSGKITEVKGTGGKDDGSTIIQNGTPGTCQIGTALKAHTKVDSSNNTFKININNKLVEITIPTSDSKGYTDGYTPSQLASELENQINSKVNDANKIKVSLSGGQLKFTTNAKGEGKFISLNGCDSKFLSSINKTTTPAMATTGSFQSLSFPFTLNSSNNKFTITIDGKNTTVNLTAKEYKNSGEIAEELNNKLSSHGVTVTRNGSSSNSGLIFTRNAAANGKNVEINNKNSGANAVIFNSPARTYFNITKNPIELPANKDAEFTVTIDGTKHTAKIPATASGKKLTLDEILEALNKATWTNGKNFTITKNGNQFIFTTNDRGAGKSITASAKAGQTKITTPSVESEVKLEGGKMTVSLKSDTAFSASPYNLSQILQPIGKETSSSPTTTTRTFKTTSCKLTTHRPTSMPNNIVITDKNNVLEFIYRYQDGNSKSIKIELEPKTYTRKSLQEALQKALDAEIEDASHSGEGLKVTVGNQITFTSKKEGYYKIYNPPSGSFYTDIMMGTTSRHLNEKTVYTDGHLMVDDIYIAGRKDVRNNTTKIQKDDNDTLSIDLTIDNVVTTLNMKLEPGNYNASSLVKQIQKKLDEAVKEYNQANPNSPLPENIVKVGVGMFDTGVKGAVNDKNSLFFYINKKADLAPGNYKIDGLGGKSLFSIFYKTDGDPFPAYIAGAKDISDGADIKTGLNDTFSIDVDGTTYNYTIPEGKYTGKELIETLNKLFEGTPDAKIKADFSGNTLKISYKELGEHKITNIQGPAKAALFYNTDNRIDFDSSLNIQAGANREQFINIEKFSMSTLNMGINSITISKWKYANKALGRLDEALNYLNERRSRYGAMQNRLEYAVDGNDITAENTQASESINRDANMAKEMVRFATSSILQQAGMSMLAQANQQTQSILALLQ